MRSSRWIIAVAAVIAICALSLLRRGGAHRNTSPQEPSSPPSAQVGRPVQPQPYEREVPQAPSAPKSAQDAPPPPTVAEASNSFYEQTLRDWQVPIEFYGKVVDEDGNPVPAASVRFHWTDMTVEDNVSTSETHSDSKGLFALNGKHGRSLEVWVSNEGYYASQHGQKGFLYAYANERFSPDPGNPVVFTLRKKGQGAVLVTSENGIRPDVAVRIPKDGTPVRVDFFRKQASEAGQLEISQQKPPWREATKWSLRMSIPDGGFVENGDEFQFEAPETGYLPAVEYHFTNGQPNWTTHLTKQYYISFGHPLEYGWLRVQSDLAQETIFLTYAINPSGSRNLEPLETKPQVAAPPPWAPPGTRAVIPEIRRP